MRGLYDVFIRHPGLRHRLQRLLPILLLAGIASTGAACADAKRTEAGADTATAATSPWTAELAEELRAMGDLDAEVREGVGPETLADSAFMGRMVRADSANSRRLQDLVAEHGWPRSAEVGPEASEAAFLIVQHTPFEDWQRAMLPTIEDAVRSGDLDGQSYALLYDRVQTKLGRPQKYGTQLTPTDDGRLRLDSLANPDDVDSLRAELGMPPLEDYLRVVEETYEMKVIR